MIPDNKLLAFIIFIYTKVSTLSNVFQFTDEQRVVQWQIHRGWWSIIVKLSCSATNTPRVVKYNYKIELLIFYQILMTIIVIWKGCWLVVLYLSVFLYFFFLFGIPNLNGFFQTAQFLETVWAPNFDLRGLKVFIRERRNATIKAFVGLEHLHFFSLIVG